MFKYRDLYNELQGKVTEIQKQSERYYRERNEIVDKYAMLRVQYIEQEKIIKKQEEVIKCLEECNGTAIK